MAWCARPAEVVSAEGNKLSADMVARIPSDQSGERERRYSQAAPVLKPLAERLRLPHEVVLLDGDPGPDKQMLKFQASAREPARGAFATRPGSRVDNLLALLVNDVLITGATLDARRRTLRDAGAKSVIGLSAAGAAGNPQPSTRQW